MVQVWFIQAAASDAHIATQRLGESENKQQKPVLQSPTEAYIHQWLKILLLDILRRVFALSTTMTSPTTQILEAHH